MAPISAPEWRLYPGKLSDGICVIIGSGLYVVIAYRVFETIKAMTETVENTCK